MEKIRNQEASDPIAVFDSGLGGISVVKKLTKMLPHENIVYFGDSINAPYGTKSIDELLSLCDKNIRLLLDMNAKCVVIACNTATSAAAAYLREKYPFLPIIGMEPAVKPASKIAERPKVLVLATPVTINGGKLKELIHCFDDEASFTLLPAPKLVEFVESGVNDSMPAPDLYDYLTDLFRDFRVAGADSDGSSKNGLKFDAVVLGCTHFPFVKRTILKALGYDVPVFDGREGTCHQVERKLSESGLLNMSKEKGTVTLLNSDESKIELEKALFES